MYDGAMMQLDNMRKSFQPWQFYTENCENRNEWDGGVLMWVIRPAEDGSWLVGYWYPNGTDWFTESVYRGDDARALAIARVRWIYGGRVPDGTAPTAGAQPVA